MVFPSSTKNPSGGLATRTPSRRALARGTDALPEMLGMERFVAHQALALLPLFLAVGLRLLVVVSAACHGFSPEYLLFVRPKNTSRPQVPPPCPSQQ